MRKLSSLLLLTIWPPPLFIAQTKAVAPSQTLVLTHVTVIDATGARPMPDMTVVVTGDRQSQ